MARKKKDKNKKEKTFEREQSGAQYQIKLLLWFMWRGIQKGYKFKIGTEIKAAEKFDDLVFYQKVYGRERYCVRYLQAKSSAYDNAVLKYEDFISSQYKARCNLKKYFHSFRKIKQKVIGGDIKDFIISTPISFPSSTLTNGDETLEFEKTTEVDDFFTSSNTDKWQSFKLLEESALHNSELRNIFNNSTNLAIMAEELAYSIYNPKEEEEDNSSEESKNDEDTNVEEPQNADKKKGYSQNKRVKLDVEKFWLSRYHLAMQNDKIIQEEIFITFNEKFLQKEASLMKSTIILPNNIQITMEKFYNAFKTELAAFTTMTENELLPLRLNKELLNIFIINDAKGKLEELLQRFMLDKSEKGFDDDYVEQTINNILKEKKLPYVRKDVENLFNMIFKKIRQLKNFKNVSLTNLFTITNSNEYAVDKETEAVMKELATATLRFALHNDKHELLYVFLSNIALFKDIFRIKVDEIFSNQFLHETSLNENIFTFRLHVIEKSGKHLFNNLKGGCINSTKEFINILQSERDTCDPDGVIMCAQEIAQHFYFQTVLTNYTIFDQNIKLLKAVLAPASDKSIKFTEKFLKNELKNFVLVSTFRTTFLQTLALYDLRNKTFDWQKKENEVCDANIIMDNLVSTFLETCKTVEDYNKPVTNRTDFKKIKIGDTVYNLFVEVFENVADEEDMYKFQPLFFVNDNNQTEHVFKSILKQQIMQVEEKSLKAKYKNDEEYKNKLFDKICDDLKQLHFKINSFKPKWNEKGMTKFADEIYQKRNMQKELFFKYDNKLYEKDDSKNVIEELFAHVFQLDGNKISFREDAFKIHNSLSEDLKRIIKKKVTEKYDSNVAVPEYNEWIKLNDLQFEISVTLSTGFNVDSENEIISFVAELMNLKKASKSNVLKFNQNFNFSNEFYNAAFQSTKQKGTNRMRFTRLLLDTKDFTTAKHLSTKIPERLTLLQDQLKQALLGNVLQELKQKSLQINSLPLCCDNEKVTFLVEKIIRGKETCKNNIIKCTKEIDDKHLEMLEYLAESVFTFGGERHILKFKKTFFETEELPKGAALFKQTLKEKMNDENEFMKFSRYRIEVSDYPLCFEDDDVQMFAEEMIAEVINSDKENKIVFTYEKNDKTKGIIEALAGSVFVSTGKVEYATTAEGRRLFTVPPYQFIKFSKEFLENDTTLPKFAKHLKNLLKEKFKKDFINLKKYEIKVVDYPFSCERMIENGNIKDDITEFCNKLLFAITPNEKDLTTIVGEEMGTELNLLNANFALNSMYRTIIDWTKDFENRFIEKKEADNYFDEIKRQIASLMMAGCNSLYCIRLKNYHISFESRMIVLESFLDDVTIAGLVNKQILYLKTDETLLTSIKVYQTLKNLQWPMMNNFRRDDTFILIPLSDLLCMQEHVVKAFASNNSNNLLVIIEDIETKLSTKLYDRLCEILHYPKNREKKKIVFISKNDTLISKFENNLKTVYEKNEDTKSKFQSFVEYYKTIFDYHNDTNTIIDFSVTSQEEMLNTKLKFQGNDIYLYQLVYRFPKNPNETYTLDDRYLKLKKRIENLDSADFFQIMSSIMLVKLVTGQRIEIGEAVKPFKNYINKCYIPRNINLMEINDQLFDENVKLKNHLFVIESHSDKKEKPKASINHIQKYLADKGVKTLPNINITSEENFVNDEDSALRHRYQLMTMKDDNIVYQGETSQYENRIELHESSDHFFALFESSNVDNEFKKICEKNPNKIVHWLKFINNKLFLFYSRFPCNQNSTNDLEFCAAATKNDEFGISVEESTLANYILENKIVLIADSAGMGKSTILTNFEKEMYRKSRKNLNVFWMIRIDLNSYTDILLDIKEKKNSPKEIFKLNFDVMGETKDYGKVILTSLYYQVVNNKQLTFENLLFQHFFENSRMVIIFDGFDEISPDFEDIIAHLLTNLKSNTNNKIWVTSRPNFQNRLQKLLNVFAFELKRFTDEEQIDYLKKFWTYKWNGFLNETQEKRMDDYARKLCQNLNVKIGKQYTKLIGIPLQTRMLAEIFQKYNNENDENGGEKWHGCFNYIFKPIHEPNFGTKIQNLFSLYENFVETKIGEYFVKEKEIANLSKPYAPKLKNLILFYENELHRILSFVALKDKYKFTSFLSKEEKKKMEKWFKEFKNGTENVGIVDNIRDDGQIIFNHLTYAEYFVACFLKEKLSTSSFVVFEIIEHILNKDVPVFLYCIKHLLFQHNQDEEDYTDTPQKKKLKLINDLSTLNYAAKNGFLNCIKHFTTYENFKENIESDKNLVHYAVKHDQINIIVCILLYVFNVFHRNPNFAKVAHFYLSSFINYLVKKKDFITESTDSYRFHEQISSRNSTYELLEEIMKFDNVCLKPKKFQHADFMNRMQNKRLNVDIILNGTNYAEYVFNDFFKFLSTKAIESIIQNTEQADLKSSILVDHSFFYNVCHRKNLEEQEKIFTCLINRFTDDQTITSIYYRVLNAALKEDCLILFKKFFNVEKLNDYTLYDLLTTACYVNNYDILKLVLPIYKNLNVREYQKKMPPLYYALLNNSSLTIVKYILENTNTNLNPLNKKSLLIVAVEMGCSLSTVKYLIEKGAKTSEKDCMFHVLNSYDQSIINYFKEKKGWLTQKNNNSESIFQGLRECIIKKDERMFKRKLKNCTPIKFNGRSIYRYYRNKNRMFKSHESLKIRAYTHNNEFEAMNKKDENGDTLLDLAAKYDLINVAKDLLEQGTYYNDVSETIDQTAESPAIQKNNTKTLLKQIDYLFNAVSKKGNFVPEKKNINLKEKYIARIKDKNGMSLIHYAVLNNNKNIIKYLKSLGSKINVQDRFGKNAMFYAVEKNDFEMVKALFDFGSYYDHYMFDNTKIENSCVTFMKEIGKCFELVYEEKFDDLINKFEATNFNMDLGDVANIRDHRKRSFFEYAQQMNNYNLVLYFFRKGAFVHEMNCTRNKKIQRLFCSIQDIFTSVIENKYDPKSIIAQIEQDECSAFIHKIKYGKYFHMHERKTLIEYAQCVKNHEVVDWCNKQMIYKHTYSTS